MEALCDRGQNGVDDVGGIEQHLVVVEPQDRVPAQRKARVGTEIASAVGCLVKGESVYLHTEARADHAVEWVPVYPDLLAHGHTGSMLSLTRS